MRVEVTVNGRRVAWAAYDGVYASSEHYRVKVDRQGASVAVYVALIASLLRFRVFRRAVRAATGLLAG